MCSKTVIHWSIAIGFAGALEPKIKGEENDIFREDNIIILIQSPSAHNNFWLYGINCFL